MFHILTKRIKTIWKIELFHFTLNNYFSYLNHPKRRLTMNFDRFPFLLHSLFRDSHWKWIVQCFQLIFLHLPLFHWLRLKLKKSLLISFEITKITIEKQTIFEKTCQFWRILCRCFLFFLSHFSICRSRRLFSIHNPKLIVFGKMEIVKKISVCFLITTISRSWLSDSSICDTWFREKLTRVSALIATARGDDSIIIFDCVYYFWFGTIDEFVYNPCYVNSWGSNGIQNSAMINAITNQQKTA